MKSSHKVLLSDLSITLAEPAIFKGKSGNEPSKLFKANKRFFCRNSIMGKTIAELEKFEESQVMEAGEDRSDPLKEQKVHESILAFLIYKYFVAEIKEFGDFDDFHSFLRNNPLLNISTRDLNRSLITALEKKFGNEKIDSVLEIAINKHENYLARFFIDGSFNFSKTNAKGKGVFYTQKVVSDLICSETISDFRSDKILDLGCGTGRFLLSCLELSPEKERTVKNIYGVETDPISVDLTILRIIDFFPKSERLELLEQLKNRIKVGNAVYSLSQNSGERFSFHSDFSSVLQSGGFDVVVMNPPYKVLKVNRSDFFNASTKKVKTSLLEKIFAAEKKRVEAEKEYVRKSGVFNYSNNGMINYYRVFLEIALRITTTRGSIGAIIPSTLLGDASAHKLRRELLENSELERLHVFREKSKMFNGVNQATVIIKVKKGEKTKKIKATFYNSKTEQFVIPFKDIQSAFTKLEIPLIDQRGWEILSKLNKFQRLKEIPEIKNRRGELDMTADKKFITKENTGLQLVRGKDLFTDLAPCYVKSTFLQRTSDERRAGIDSERLVGPQIGNIDTAKKLRFRIVEPRSVVANSCNYIVGSNKFQNKTLLPVLNSSVLNWRFKITNYNNHISNYEIGELPIPPAEKLKPQMSETEIMKAYGLNDDEIKYIRAYYD